MKTIALIGAGGHCKMIIDLIKILNNYEIVGIYDDNREGIFCDYKILGKVKDINTNIENFIIAIGNDYIRHKIYEENKNLNWCTLIHPSAIISKNTKIDVGTVVSAGSIIQTEVKIGKQCIINTGCSIDHECIVGDFTSICPKATLCGQVKVGNLCLIGANSVIIQNKSIGNNCIVGAGSVVIRDVGDHQKVVGNPAKNI